MKKIFKITVLLLVAILCFASADAKGTKSKRKTTTTQKASTGRGFEKWKDNIPTPAYIYEAVLNEKSNLTKSDLDKDLESRGYKETENENGYYGYTLPNVFSIHFWQFNEYDITGIQVEIEVKDRNALGWFVEQAKALKKRDKYVDIYIDGNEIGFEKYFKRKGW